MRFRVPPSILLALAVAGMAVQIVSGGLAGVWIVWAGWMGTFMCQPFGFMPRPSHWRMRRNKPFTVTPDLFRGDQGGSWLGRERTRSNTLAGTSTAIARLALNKPGHAA